VSLVGDWQRIEAGLPDRWGDARLALTVEDNSQVGRAAALLGPLNPGRRGRELRFFVGRRGVGFGPDQLRRLLRRLDEEGIRSTLELLASDQPVAAPAVTRPSLATGWDELHAALPDDWSDLYCELELTSTDHLERGALLLAPLNPARFGGTVGFRFRVARRRGYGASPGMARRCFERLDEEGIPGRLQILHALSDTRPVATQGPVWRVSGRSV
jgi:hypothetical protein